MKSSRLALTFYSLALASGMQTSGMQTAWSAVDDRSVDDRPMELRMIAHEALDGDDGAQLLYGLAYLKGRDGLKPDAKKAVYWLRRSARMGNAYAALVLGNCYSDGLGVKKDLNRALQWWRKAAQNGNAKAQYLLGKVYLEGSAGTKDHKQALDWLIKSAKQGDKHAQYLLGKMYYEGYHVPKDKDVARSWLNRAAEQAHKGAINLLAIIDGLVDVATKIYQQSFDVLLDKAKQGDPQAEYELGLRYESGAWDVNKDDKQALIWISKAAEGGNRVAMKTLANIYQHGDLGLQPNPAKAAEWKKKASATAVKKQPSTLH